jgi:hypothetical protein
MIINIASIKDHGQYNGTTSMNSSFPINSAACNAVWIHDTLVEPRFADAPTLVEKRRIHEMPDFNSLPEAADIAVELYGGAITLRLDGGSHRVSIRRFEYVSFPTDEEARYGFLTLWREVETLESVVEVERIAEEWLEKWKRKTRIGGLNG